MICDEKTEKSDREHIKFLEESATHFKAARRGNMFKSGFEEIEGAALAIHETIKVLKAQYKENYGKAYK